MKHSYPEHLSLPLDVFLSRFAAFMIDTCGSDRIAYGMRVGDYAAQIAAWYWYEFKQEPRSPEDCAADDMSFWAVDHGSAIS
jgi:hypothetical protein